jgi:SNF2 family DNA or RNA helicase
MSLRAGGVGLNLQPTNVVVLFDRWWNPAVEAQAIGRALRFGRTSPLHVIRFLCDATIEQRIEEVLREKQVLFEELVNEAPNARTSSGLSKQDLARVLDLQPGPKVEEI